MNRKYRQQGYQDQSVRSEPRPKEARPEKREGPKSPQMPGFGRVIKCASCGRKLAMELEDVSYTSLCPHCSADLHTCRNCVFFNPSSRFECEQPVPGRVVPKDKRTDCEFFQIRSTVEKIVSSTTQRVVDPRAAFENLFKR